MTLIVDEWAPGWGPEKLSRYAAPDPGRRMAQLQEPVPVWGFKAPSRNIGSGSLRRSLREGLWVSRRHTRRHHYSPTADDLSPFGREAWLNQEPVPCSAAAVHLAVLPNFSLGSPWYTDEWIYVGVMQAYGIHSNPGAIAFGTNGGIVPVEQTYKYYGKAYRVVAKVACPLGDEIHEHGLDDFVGVLGGGS